MQPPKSLRLTPIAAAMAFGATVGLTTDAHALEWRFRPEVSSAVTYTDNVNQTEAAQDALILSVTPAFRLVSEGSRRIKATVNYGLTGVTRISDDTTNNIYHNLGAVGKAELVEDFLFIDGTAAISQELISLFGSNADARTNDSNRATVGTYSLSPYIKKRLGTFANAEARFTTGGAIFNSNNASDVNSNQLVASLFSGTSFTGWNWGIDYSNRQTSSKNAPDSSFERLTGTIGMMVTPKIRVLGLYGFENNDFIGAANTSGPRYGVGITWIPSRRTSLDATIGKRSFGRTYGLAASHRTRTTSWRVSYSEDFTDVGLLAIYNTNVKTVNVTCSSNVVVPPTATLEEALATPGCKLDSQLYGTSIQNGIFLAKLLTANASWSVRRMNLGVSLSDLRRIYQQVRQGEDRTQFVTTTLNYRLSPHTSVDAGLSLGRISTNALLGAPDRQDTLYGLNLGIGHQFSRDLTGALTFRHQERSSSAAHLDYVENSLTASATLRF